MTPGDERYRLMLREAEDRVLYVSPPYADESARRAFLSGYETALHDIARGFLKVPS